MFVLLVIGGGVGAGSETADEFLTGGAAADLVKLEAHLRMAVDDAGDDAVGIRETPVVGAAGEVGVERSEGEYGDAVVGDGLGEFERVRQCLALVHGELPSRYLVFGFGGARYPVLDSKMVSYENMDKSTKDGGNQIEYHNEDPRVLDLYERELAGRGLNSKMREFVGTRG